MRTGICSVYLIGKYSKNKLGKYCVFQDIMSHMGGGGHCMVYHTIAYYHTIPYPVLHANRVARAARCVRLTKGDKVKHIHVSSAFQKSSTCMVHSGSNIKFYLAIIHT